MCKYDFNKEQFFWYHKHERVLWGIKSWRLEKQLFLLQSSEPNFCLQLKKSTLTCLGWRFFSALKFPHFYQTNQVYTKHK